MILGLCHRHSLKLSVYTPSIDPSKYLFLAPGWRLFMTIPPALGKLAPAQIQGHTPGSNKASSTQPLEIRDVIPSTLSRGTTITKQEGHVVKPWAHFVAGGYTAPETVAHWRLD